MYVNVLQKKQESCVLVCMRKLNTSVACHIVNSTYDRARLKNHKPKGFTNMIDSFSMLISDIQKKQNTAKLQNADNFATSHLNVRHPAWACVQFILQT